MNALSAAAAFDLLIPRARLSVLVCGIAGSGKTTFSRALASKGFVRISIDEEIWRAAGRYGLDYPAEAYPEKLEDARRAMKRGLEVQLTNHSAVVVDSSFWRRAERDEFRAVAARLGGQTQLVYMKASAQLLLTRVRERSRQFNANAARPIDNATLEQFIENFQEPTSDEGALVVDAAMG